MNKVIHTPEGVRDIYGEEFDERNELKRRMTEAIEAFGYKGVETPSIEFFDVFSKEIGTTPSKNLYRFFDREGNTLSLRPDFTPGVCRLAASHFSSEDGPQRLTYSGNVFVNYLSYKGRLNESNEIGAELLFDDSVDADCEVIAACCEALSMTGLSEFTIALGHSDILRGLIRYGKLSEDEEIVKNYITNHNNYGLFEFLDEKGTDEAIREIFELVLNHNENSSFDERLLELSKPYPLIRDGLKRLSDIYELLKLYGVAVHVSIDPGLISRFSYYTGIIFTGFAFGTGEPVAAGGRYDELLKSFSSEGPAVGFALFTDEVYTALKSKKISLARGRAEKVIEYSEEEKAGAIKEAMELRRSGTVVTIKRKCEE